MEKNSLTQIIEKNEGTLLAEWIAAQLKTLASIRDRISEAELRINSHDFLMAFRQGLASGGTEDITADEWADLREMLTNLSRERAEKGFSPSETASFIFSFKPPVFRQLRQAYLDDPPGLANQVEAVTVLLDKLGLFTTEVFLKTREKVIALQQQEMLELSTPVVELWAGILALPLIGTLDSARTQIVMQNLLEAIVAKESDIAIIDISGVPTVDTLVAQHLMKTVAAARLMGAECLISGIRPQIAQTIIHLGVDLGGVTTKANLADAFRIALKKKNFFVERAGKV